MGVTLRNNKGSALTFTELDTNFTDFMTLTGSGATRTLSSINAPDFNSTSDARLKENIQLITSAIEKLNGIKGVTYNFINDPEKLDHAGVLAQDVIDVLPQAVKLDHDNYYRVSYNGVVALLVEVVKQQQEIINQQSKKLLDIELELANSKILNLESRLTQLESR
jgi:hypothetical protein